MEAIYIGNDTNWWRTRPGPNHKQQQQQQQQGPFIMADFEDGMFAGECVSVVSLLPTAVFKYTTMQQPLFQQQQQQQQQP